MKVGLLTFPNLFSSFYMNNVTNFVQRLEPSVLYVAPETCDVEFIHDNEPREDIDVYLCSLYTRGWNEFKEFSNRVGREKIIAGGYHATALPQEVFKYASKVIEGYCGNIDDIVHSPFSGIFKGEFKFTHMRRDLLDLKQMKQVYPDILEKDISGSMVSSVGCPYDCDFCSTPNMSGKSMKTSSIEYVEREIEDLLRNGATTVFIRDESFATNPQIKEFATLFKDKFKVLYSFGTGAVMAKREDWVKHLVSCGWHSLNFGLEDVGVNYRKNKSLKDATDNCNRNGMKYVMSFIVNDDGKTIEEARLNYKALYSAFVDLLPSQVCANFLMPFPGTGIWNQYKDKISEEDFDKFDSKTPIFSNGEKMDWHKRMLVAVQLKYYRSSEYRSIRNFECNDNLHLRMMELENEYELRSVDTGNLLEI